MMVFLLIMFFIAVVGGKYIIMIIMLLPLKYWMGREKSRSKIYASYGVNNSDSISNKKMMKEYANIRINNHSVNCF